MWRLGGFVARSLPCAGVVATLALLPTTNRADDARRPAAGLRLVWVDLSGISPTHLEAATERMQSILAPAGVRISARRAVPGVADDTEGVWVVLMRSRPRTRPPSDVVAGAAGRPGDWPPTVWVCPAVVSRGLRLDMESAHLWTLLQRRDFAHGLAAVVVHELAHAMFGALHQPRGLEAARLGARDLVDQNLALDPGLCSAFRAAVAALDAGRAPSLTPTAEPAAYVPLLR